MRMSAGEVRPTSYTPSFRWMTGGSGTLSPMWSELPLPVVVVRQAGRMGQASSHALVSVCWGRHQPVVLVSELLPPAADDVLNKAAAKQAGPLLEHPPVGRSTSLHCAWTTGTREKPPRCFDDVVPVQTEHATRVVFREPKSGLGCACWPDAPPGGFCGCLLLLTQQHGQIWQGPQNQRPTCDPRLPVECCGCDAVAGPSVQPRQHCRAVISRWSARLEKQESCSAGLSQLGASENTFAL
jgi:hypothetical protein